MSDLAQGDSEVPYVVVAPADGSTTVTLEVRPPSGDPYTVAVTGGSLEPVENSDDEQQLWAADEPVVYSLPGKWVLHWTVTGTGEGAEDHEVYVAASPVAGGPAWTPGRSRVAAYVPHRTLARDLAATGEGQEQHQYSFDSTTSPPGIVVDKLISDAVAWISTTVYPMHIASTVTAGALSALRAAIDVERAWPNDDSSLQRANDMERRFDTMLAQLVKSNDDRTAEDAGVEEGFDIVPMYSFPRADPRWDCPTYW